MRASLVLVATLLALTSLSVEKAEAFYDRATYRFGDPVYAEIYRTVPLYQSERPYHLYRAHRTPFVFDAGTRGQGGSFYSLGGSEIFASQFPLPEYSRQHVRDFTIPARENRGCTLGWNMKNTRCSHRAY
jgi:hypothetical protein